MIFIKEVIQNWLMGFRVVQNLIKKYHSTGLNRNPENILKMFEFYNSHVPVQGRSILELGPGQTLGVLKMALQNGAAACSAVDILQYSDEEEIRQTGIDFRLYDGKSLPYEDAKFDLVWASDVFEHLRYPRITVREAHRVLKPGGHLLIQVALHDHYFLHDETRWLDCLQYGTFVWNAMTWNRSSYVNRLRFSQWKELFEETGFAEVYLMPARSDVLRLQARDKTYLRKYSEDDISVYRFEAVLQKRDR